MIMSVSQEIPATHGREDVKETELPVCSVKVKALEWLSDREPLFATTPFCRYRISPVHDDTGPHWTTTVTYQGSVYHRSETEAEAKADAQADYERRILSALTLKDDPGKGSEADPLRKALEQAERALKPLADAVFNDNGDMTVNLPSPTSEECIAAYFVERRIAAAIRALLPESAPEDAACGQPVDKPR
jgi:hypothetical protein